jgi:positive regulator of sigma E activity
MTDMFQIIVLLACVAVFFIVLRHVNRRADRRAAQPQVPQKVR